AEQDRVRRTVRELQGEPTEPVGPGLRLQPLELGSLPLPALLDDAHKSRYHQREEPRVGLAGQPDEVGLSVDAEDRVERDRGVLRAGLEPSLEDLPDGELAA